MISYFLFSELIIMKTIKLGNYNHVHPHFKKNLSLKLHLIFFFFFFTKQNKETKQNHTLNDYGRLQSPTFSSHGQCCLYKKRLRNVTFVYSHFT